MPPLQFGVTCKLLVQVSYSLLQLTGTDPAPDSESWPHNHREYQGLQQICKSNRKVNYSIPLTITSTKHNSPRHLRDIHCLEPSENILLWECVTQTDHGKLQTLWGEAATEAVAVKAKAPRSGKLPALPALCCCNVIKPLHETPTAVGATHRIPGTARKSQAECGTGTLRECTTTNILSNNLPAFTPRAAKSQHHS